MAFKYFNVKNGLTAGNINLNASNATVETGNLIVSGDSNLGSVSNLTITGGTNGQVLTTDGAGNLSFSSGTSNPAPMPYQIDDGETVTVPEKYQGLFSYPITVDGNLEIDGVLIEVGQDALESVPGQVLYDNNGIPTGNSGFTFDPVTGNLAAPGNITATNFIGNGSQLTGITASGATNISNGISNVNIATSGGNVTVAVGGTGNIIIATSTGVNVTGTFNSSGNANVANIGATEGVFSANVTAFNMYANSGLVSAQNLKGEGGNISNIQGGNVSGAVGSATTAGTVTTAAQPNVTSVGVLTGLVMAGNITPNVSNTYNLGNSDNRWNNLFLAGNTIYLGEASIGSNGTSVTITNPDGGQFVIAGNGTASSNTIYNGNSNVSIPSSNGNIILSATGTANVLVVSSTGANITGTLNTSGNANVGNLGATGVVATTLGGSLTTNAQPNITSVGTLSSVDVTGNVTTGNLYANSGIIGAGTLKGEGGNISNVQAANISGTVATATTAGTVTTAAQPNVTSVGTLTGLGVNGNITAANITANTGVFTGNGRGLTNLSASNIDTGTLAQARLANSSLTVNGTSISLGGSGTITANTTQTLTLGSYLTGTSFNGGTAVTATVDATTTNTANKVVARDANGSFSANIITATLSGSATSAGTATTAGTVTTAAQPNVTSVGTLSSLTVTGNITSSANVVTDLIVGKTTSVSIAATGSDQNIYLKPTGTGSVDVWGKVLGNLAAPIASTDAATKDYVDNIAQGLHTHDACGAATPDTLANISSGTVTYDNGTSGVGATLTTTGSYTTIDGVNVASAGFRILVKNEANAAHNGIYTYTSGTVLTRAADFNTPTEMAGGDFTFVQQGTLYNDTGWVMPDPVITVGTTAVNWTQFSGAGTYTAGTGLTLTGTQFNISNTTITAGSYGNGDRVATFTVNSQGQLTAASNVAITANAANLTGTTLNSTIVNSSLTSVGTLGTLSVTGNANVGNIGATNGVFTNVSGNGAALTAIAGANVTGQVGNALVAGTVYTAAQPNITSVGTLTSLNVTGNANVGNIGATNGVFTNVSGNGSALTALNASNISTGTLAQARLANSSLTVNGTAISLGGSATITANTTQTLTLGSYLTGTSFNGGTAVTANVDATTTNTASKVVARDANGSFSANIITATLSGAATTAGTVTTAAQPNITSVGTLTSLSVSGNVTAANFIGSLANGNSDINIPAANGNINFDIAGNANVVVMTGTGVNVAGTLNATGNANVNNLGTARVVATGNISGTQLISNIATGTAPLVVTSTTTVANLAAATATTAGTVTTAAQPNITSVGTLTSLAVTGNVTGANFIGSFANGNSSVSIPSANGNINISSAGNTNIVVVTGTGVNVAGTLNATGNANVGNIGATAGVFTGNVSAANIIGNLANGTTDISIPAANGNINFDIAGTSNVFVIASGGSITSANLADAVGYKGIPQNAQTGGYALALTDIGKHISITVGGITIPANGSISFPIGATIVIFNNSASTQTIAITTDTLRQAGTSNTGTRTLAAYGIATLIKVAATVWVVSGNVT